MSKMPKHCVVKFSTITKRLKNNNVLQPSVKLAIKTEPGLIVFVKVKFYTSPPLMSAIPNALKAEFDAYDFLQNTFSHTATVIHPGGTLTEKL